jgi:lipopolysaccharide/colanic/teichoic acid biosynthesis glycosyltransferase
MGTFYLRRGKRMLDVVGATSALIVSSPIQLAAAVTVRRKMGAPVFFRQQRPGLEGRSFTLLKFRTMRSPELGENSMTSDAQRLTPLGRFMRSSSIDELPEFWNVLRGDMSLVGPRPLLVEYLGRYTPEEARRHEVRPGITGWAQINGRNFVSWKDKFEMDVWYVDHVSFGLDLRILWHTVVAVVNRTGISASGHETMTEFNPMV